MDTQDRRQTSNQALRHKIDQIQAANQRLKDAADQLEQHALEGARRGDWASVSAQQTCRDLFNQQKKDMEVIKQHMAPDEKMPSQTILISAEEMDALMGHQH